MERVVSFCGLFVMIGLAWLMSSHKTKISFRVVLVGLLLQFAAAVVILRTPQGREAFAAAGRFFTSVLGFVEEGTEFVFGINPRADDPELPPRITLVRSFAFAALPTIIFFSSLMAILYYLGIMQRVVTALAWVMQRTMGVSGAESLSAAANVFVGQTEAPLVVRPYVPAMTESELTALMVGGFATVSGGLLAAYVSLGVDAGHLITASVISAPAALVIAKVMAPEIAQPQTLGTVRVEVPVNGVNVIDAAANGAGDGLKLALNVGAMLIAFIALIAMINAGLGWIGENVFNRVWSLELAFGYLFAPLAWVMGVEWNDCSKAGELLGVKIVVNEFVAYDGLGKLAVEGPDAEISDRTKTILTYAISGFSNFGAIGIQIGGIGGIAPERRSDLARIGLKAMFGGTLACCMTACVAGVLI